MDFTEQDGWLSDASGNRASVEYFGSREAAKTALASLENCKNTDNCSRCSDCSGCSGCSDCSRCSRCSGCSDCSDCSGCSGCSGCSNVANALENTDALSFGWTGQPQVPVLPEIDKMIYEAASRPGAFDMSTPHVCDTTHCRAGWALAAQLIYRESGAPINPGRFCPRTGEALADMKARADAPQREESSNG